MAMTPEELINSIINNAILTASEYTNKVDETAQELLRAADGVWIEPPPTESGFSVEAVEPEIPTGNDTTLVFEAQLANVQDLLTQQLADFFTTYYPLESDSFDEAQSWLVNQITTGGTKLNIDYIIGAHQDFNTDDDTDTDIDVDTTGMVVGSTAVPVAINISRVSSSTIDSLADIDTSIDNPLLDNISTDTSIVINTDIDELVSSGLGLSPEIAEQEWQRAREQVIADGRRTEQQIVTGYASRGYSLAAGSMLKKIEESRMAQLKATGAAATDIATKQVAFSLEIAKLEKAIVEQRINFQLDKAKLDADIKQKEIAFDIDVAKISVDADITWKQIGYDVTLATKKVELEIDAARLALEIDKANADISAKEIAYKIDVASKQVQFNIDKARIGEGKARIELEKNAKQIEYDVAIAEKNSRFKIEKEKLKDEKIRLEAERARILTEIYRVESEMVKFAINSAIQSRTSAMQAAGDYIRVMTTAPDTAVKVAGLNTDIQSKMMNAASDFYRARLSRDELVLKSKMAKVDGEVDIYKVRRQTQTGNLGNQVQALNAAADAYARTAASALSSLNSVVSTATNSFS